MEISLSKKVPQLEIPSTEGSSPDSSSYALGSPSTKKKGYDKYKKRGKSSDRKSSLNTSHDHDQTAGKKNSADMGHNAFNMLAELHRMHGTFRAQTFGEVLAKNHKSEPFECWTAIEDIIRGVREDLYESARHRTEKLISVIHRFVLDDAPKAIPISSSVKADMQKLMDQVRVNPEYWDGRPLVQLQREAAMLLHEDLRMFFLDNPWTEADHVSDIVVAGSLSVLISTKGKMTAQKKEDFLRVTKAGGSSDGSTSPTAPESPGSKAGRRVSIVSPKSSPRTSGSSKSFNHSKSLFTLRRKTSGLRPKLNFCKLTSDSFFVYPGQGDPKEKVSSGLSLCQVKLGTASFVHGYQDFNVFELRSAKDDDDAVLLLVDCGDKQNFNHWYGAVKVEQSRLMEKATMLLAKQDRILKTPVVLPPKVRAFLQAGMKLDLNTEPLRARSSTMRARAIQATSTVSAGNVSAGGSGTANTSGTSSPAEPSPRTPTKSNSTLFTPRIGSLIRNPFSKKTDAAGVRRESKTSSGDSGIDQAVLERKLTLENLRKERDMEEEISFSTFLSDLKTDNVVTSGSTPSANIISPKTTSLSPRDKDAPKDKEVAEVLREMPSREDSRDAVAVELTPSSKRPIFLSDSSIESIDLRNQLRKMNYQGTSMSDLQGLMYGAGENNVSLSYAALNEGWLHSKRKSEEDAESKDNEESVSDGDEADEGNFNKTFQDCMMFIRSANSLTGVKSDDLKLATYMALIRLAEDFVEFAVRYGRIIISEVHLPSHKKTIRPDSSVGGVIGGEKFIVHNILFKFAIDSHKVFGNISLFLHFSIEVFV